MEREYIGKGSSHWVFRARNHPNKVLKVPTNFSLMLLKLSAGGTKHLRQELEASAGFVEGSGIIIPKTRIIGQKKGYIIIQDLIEKDESIPNIPEYVQKQSNRFMQDLYDSSPDNFISCNSQLYWIDPVRGIFARFIDHFGSVPFQRYVHFRAKLKRTLRSFMV